MQFRWVLVDIETTGLNILRDKITEIALIVMTEKGIETRWHSLINPSCVIPDTISSLTGITNSMVSSAPYFYEVAETLMSFLEDGILVAHNARFDYGFLKNAFKASGYTLKMPVLCTIKLWKKLYPGLPKYSLSHLTERFNIPTPISHRAEADVNSLKDLLNIAMKEFALEHFMSTAKSCYQKSSIPSKLETDIKTIPNSPGVYLFYGKSSLLYIGKSISLRQRVLSHFQADHNNAKEFTMAQQVERIEYIPTAGELSALLLESRLIKEKMPLFNRKLRRKKTMVGFKLIKKGDYIQVEIEKGMYDPEENSLFGSFRSVTAAKSHLLKIIKNNTLCSKLCGIETSKHPCFNYQLKRCLGACIGAEPAELYNERVNSAFQALKQVIWPYPGKIAIKEQCEVNQLTQYLVFDQWRHLTTVNSQEEVLDEIKNPLQHDYDAYQILNSYLKQSTDNLLVLN